MPLFHFFSPSSILLCTIMMDFNLVQCSILEQHNYDIPYFTNHSILELSRQSHQTLSTIHAFHRFPFVPNWLILSNTHNWLSHSYSSQNDWYICSFPMSGEEFMSKTIFSVFHPYGIQSRTSCLEFYSFIVTTQNRYNLYLSIFFFSYV